MSEPHNLPTYATFGVINAFREVVHALRERNKADNALAVALERIDRDEQRIARCLGKPVRQLDIMEIGGGQQMERARYFGINNQVTAMDLDVIPCGFDLGSYLRMFQKNGFGRLGKTVGLQGATIAPEPLQGNVFALQTHFINVGLLTKESQ